MVSQPISTTMTNTAHVATSSMFVTLPETLLYGGPSARLVTNPCLVPFLAQYPFHGPLSCHLHSELHLALL